MRGYLHRLVVTVEPFGYREVRMDELLARAGGVELATTVLAEVPYFRLLSAVCCLLSAHCSRLTAHCCLLFALSSLLLAVLFT
jgi:hypothetical protein